MSVIELYGVLDPNTRDWTDGLLSSVFRDINKPTGEIFFSFAFVFVFVFFFLSGNVRSFSFAKSSGPETEAGYTAYPLDFGWAGP